VERYRVQDGLRRLRKLNGEIVTLLRRYQSAMSKQEVGGWGQRECLARIIVVR
jgi:hypothetical protein